MLRGEALADDPAEGGIRQGYKRFHASPTTYLLEGQHRKPKTNQVVPPTRLQPQTDDPP